MLPCMRSHNVPERSCVTQFRDPLQEDEREEEIITLALLDSGMWVTFAFIKRNKNMSFVSLLKGWSFLEIELSSIVDINSMSPFPHLIR